MADDVNIPQEGGIGSVQGTVGVAASFTILQNLYQSLSQILHNPLAAGSAFYAIGNQIEHHLNKKLKEGIELTKAQNAELEKIMGSIKVVTALSGAFTSLAFRIAQTTIELRKASVEMGKFSSYSNLPGGGANPIEAARYMRQKELSNTITYNPEFAKSIEENRKRFQRTLPKSMGGENREQFITDLAAYSQATGLDVSKFITTLTSSRRTFKTGESEAKQILDQLMVGIRQDKFGKLSPEEVLNLYLQSTDSAVKGGINANTAKIQSMKMLETLGGQPEGSEFGAGDITPIISLNTKLRDAETALKFKALTGKSVSEDWMENLGTMQQYVKKQLGGTSVESAAALFEKMGPEAWAKRFKIAPEFGITPEIFSILGGEDIQKVEPTLTKQYQSLKTGDKFSKSAEAKAYIDEILGGLEDTSNLIEAISAYLEKFVIYLSEMGEEAGLSPKVMQGIGIGGGFGITYLGGRYLKGKGTKYIEGLLKGGTKGGDEIAGGLSKILNPKTGKPFEKIIEEVAGVGTKEAGFMSKIGKFGKGASKLIKVGGKWVPLVGESIDAAITAGTEMYESSQGGASWHESYLRGIGKGSDATLNALLFGPRSIYQVGSTLFGGDKFSDLPENIWKTFIGDKNQVKWFENIPDLFYGDKTKSEEEQMKEILQMQQEKVDDRGVPLIRIQILTAEGNVVSDNEIRSNGQDIIRAIIENGSLTSSILF
ncbi:MAG: hypothetical protein M0R03_14425 [Novosphingobium sp.]|nr:hypothetical protein [Novosphingobium sp.]